MKLNVEIESGSFEKVIEQGINSLSPDELKDIIKQVILEAFTKCEDFKNLLTKRDYVSYSSASEIQLGPLAEAAVKNIDLEKELAPFKEKMVKALMENHQRIVEDMLFRCLVDKITYSDQLQESLRNAVHMVLSEERNRG